MTNQQIDTDREAVLRRVQKLLAIAQDDRANPNEAAAAAEQAEKIMRKFQIDNAEILTKRMKAGSDLATGDVVATAKTNGTKVVRVPPWAQWLAVAVGRLNDCGVRIQRTREGEACIRFYGYEADVKVACWTFDYLVATTNRLCTAFRKDPRYIVGGRPVMNSYRQGVSQGILGAIRKLAAEKEAEVARLSTSTALVIVKQQAITAQYGDFEYGSKKTTTTRNVDAYAAGRVEGSKVDVARRGVGHTNTTQQRLN